MNIPWDIQICRFGTKFVLSQERVFSINSTGFEHGTLCMCQNKSQEEAMKGNESQESELEMQTPDVTSLKQLNFAFPHFNLIKYRFNFLHC